MEKPLVSICVPAFNHENYIGSCLDSIFSQTYENIELLICDDCSTDNTFSIIEDKINKLNRKFVYVSYWKNETNKGLVKNCNTLVRRCKGKYIKIIASDDMLCKDAIGTMAMFLEEHSNADAVFTNGYICGKDSIFPCADDGIYSFFYKKNPIRNEDNVAQQLYEGNFIYAPGVMVKAMIYDKIGLYDETLCFEDWDFWIRLALNGKIDYINEPCVYYRSIGTSMSHYDSSDIGKQKAEKMLNSALRMIDKYAHGYGLNFCKAEEKLYSYFLQVAIDTDNEGLIRRILMVTKIKNLHISSETKMKLYAYRMGVLRYIQSMKKKLGMNTANFYE